MAVETVNEKAPSTAESQPTQTSQTDENEKITDGGFAGWSTVAGCWLLQFSTSGYVNAFGVYQDYYTRVYLTKYSASDISWIGSTNNLLVFGTGVITGRLFDLGYFRAMMIGGAAVFIFCLFMMSLSSAQQYYQLFLSQGVGLGVAQGFLYLPSLGAVGKHFNRRRTLALGIVATGAAVGGIVHPIMLNQLFNGHIGFHNGVRISGALNGAALLAANLLCSDRKHEEPKLGNSDNNPKKPKVDRIRKKWYQFFMEPSYNTAVAGNFLFFLGGYFPLFYLQLDAVLHNVDMKLSFYSLAIMNAANLPGRIIPNHLAGYFGINNLMILSAVVCAAIILSFVAVHDAAGIIAVAIVYGFASGAYVSLLAPMLASLADHVDEIGTRMGICFALGGLATFIGPPIQGALLTSRFLWLRPALFSGACVAAGLCFMIAARYFLRKKLTAQNPDLK